MNIVAMVLAGGEGTRLHPLTAEHAKPAVPFANGYRLVDFVLSNLVNSRISTIYVLAQYKPESLMKHIASAWAPWFADGEGMIKTLLPRSNTLGGQFKGTADAVYQYLDILQAHSPDLVAVFAADHVYRMDVRQMVAFHRERRADVTVAAVGVPLAQASHFGVLGTAPDGRISEFQRETAARRRRCRRTRPARTPRWAITCSIPKCWRRRCSTRAAAATPISAATSCPLCASRRVYAYDFAENRVPGLQDNEEPGYWRDVGTLSALAAAQQDAMGSPPRFNSVEPPLADPRRVRRRPAQSHPRLARRSPGRGQIRRAVASRE